MDSSGSLDPQPVVLMGEDLFYIFKQNVARNEIISINGHTIS